MVKVQKRGAHYNRCSYGRLGDTRGRGWMSWLVPRNHRSMAGML